MINLAALYAADLSLLYLGAVALALAPRQDTVLVVGLMIFSASASHIVIDYLHKDVEWFGINAAILLLGCMLTRSFIICVLYLTAMVYCLLVVIEWRTSSFILYNLYGYIMASIYMLQLFAAYGMNADADSLNDHRVDSPAGPHRRVLWGKTL